MADNITSFGESYFNKKPTFFQGSKFYGDVTFDESSSITFPANSFVNINKLSVNSVSVASSITTNSVSTNSVTTSVVSVASSVLVGSGVTITTSSVQVTAGIVTATTFFGNGTIPVGGIIMWSGTVANIPTGWALCDGTNSTPDLRNRFIVGAHSDGSTGVTFNAATGATSGNYGPGNTGGVTSHKLTVGEMPSHQHTYSDRTNEGTGGGQGGGGADTGTTTLSKSTGSSGGNNYHENRPPYYAVAFIMRTV